MLSICIIMALSNIYLECFLFPGVYMLIIAGVDLYYQGVFIEYSDIWKSSWLCKLAGFLATFSSEGSVMFLAALTVDRFINIIFPFSGLKWSRSTTIKVVLMIWLIAFIVGGIPLLPIDYFGGNYYGRSGVCMALPLTNEKPQGKSSKLKAYSQLVNTKYKCSCK